MPWKCHAQARLLAAREGAVGNTAAAPGSSLTSLRTEYMRYQAQQCDILSSVQARCWRRGSARLATRWRRPSRGCGRSWAARRRARQRTRAPRWPSPRQPSAAAAGTMPGAPTGGAPQGRRQVRGGCEGCESPQLRGEVTVPTSTRLARQHTCTAHAAHILWTLLHGRDVARASILARKLLPRCQGLLVHLAACFLQNMEEHGGKTPSTAQSLVRAVCRIMWCPDNIMTWPRQHELQQQRIYVRWRCGVLCRPIIKPEVAARGARQVLAAARAGARGGVDIRHPHRAAAAARRHCALARRPLLLAGARGPAAVRRCSAGALPIARAEGPQDRLRETKKH